MKRRILSIVLTTLILLGQGANLTLADGLPLRERTDSAFTDAANAPWMTSYITIGDVVSLAFTISGRPVISFYDDMPQDLLLAWPASSGGNCGPHNSWLCQTVDSEGDVGRFNSVATHEGVLFDTIGVSYFDMTHGNLKYAEWHCVGLNCSWDVDTVDSNGLFYNGWRGSSLKFDSQGIPHIAYYAMKRTINIEGELRHAYRVGSGGNCLWNTAWQCETVDSGNNQGLYPSLAFDANDQPRIAYGQLDGVYYRLWFAERHASPTPGNCNPVSDHWSCTFVYPFAGMHNSLVIAPDPQTSVETAHIASYSPTNKTVVYAHDHYDGESCATTVGNPNGWECVDIAIVWPQANEYPQLGLSIAADAQGYPIIAFEDASNTQGSSKLIVARPKSAYGLILGNCGPQMPPPFNAFTWTCKTLDEVINSSSYVIGQYASVAVSPSGLAGVAYSAAGPVSYLNYAYQRFQVSLPLVTK